MAPKDGTRSIPPKLKLVVTLPPNHSTLQWYPTMAPSNGTTSTAPCNGTLVPRPIRQSGSSPSPLLEVRTPIAIAIWGNKSRKLFQFFWTSHFSGGVNDVTWLNYIWVGDSLCVYCVYWVYCSMIFKWSSISTLGIETAQKHAEAPHNSYLLLATVWQLPRLWLQEPKLPKADGDSHDGLGSPWLLGLQKGVSKRLMRISHGTLYLL